MRSACSLLLLWLAAASLSAAESPPAPAEEFAAATSAYEKGDFSTAESGYSALVEDGFLNTDLLYNLGNTNFRLGDQGEAALWYARTLTLDPTHREARQNLAFLERTRGLLQFEPEDFESTLSKVRSDTLLSIATFCGWLAVLGVAATFCLRLRGGAKAALWTISPILALLAITAAVGIYLKNQQNGKLTQRAIVTKADTRALSSPARLASTVIALPAGSEIKVIGERGEWRYVDLPRDLRAWVPADSIEAVWPYDVALAD